MAQVTLFGTTGTYPSLAKDAGDVKYIFYPEPKIHWGYKKQNEYDDLPFVGAPSCYDAFVMTVTLKLTGYIQPTTSGQPPGAKSLKERMTDLIKWMSHYGTFQTQPDSGNASQEVFCLEITMPDASTMQHFVAIDSVDFDWAGGMTSMSLTANFREVSEVILL